MAGERDAKYADIAKAAAQLSRGELVIVPDVGHALWSEAPAAKPLAENPAPAPSKAKKAPAKKAAAPKKKPAAKKKK
jgi:hypothetical protein